MTPPSRSSAPIVAPSTTPRRVRVCVDGTKCDAYGICALRLPERISLDEWGYARVSIEPISRRGTMRRARRAVSACPNGALRVELTT